MRFHWQTKLLAGILLTLGMHLTAAAQDRTFLYQRHADGKIWRFTGPACTGNNCPGWQMLDNNTQTRSLALGEIFN